MIIPNIWGRADAVLPNRLDCRDHKVPEEFKAKMVPLVLRVPKGMMEMPEIQELLVQLVHRAHGVHRAHRVHKVHRDHREEMVLEGIRVHMLNLFQQIHKQ